MQKRIKYFLFGILILFAVAAGSKTASAQNATDFRFNEILVLNDSSFVDDFGIHSPWIELFNTSYSTINIAGCFLTDDLNNPTKYWIPSEDPATEISRRGYIVFWADQKPTRGIFHLNFTLEAGKTIALFNADGKTLIDKVEIPMDQSVDITDGRVNYETSEWEKLNHSTPGANNDHSRKASSGENFIKMDPYGIAMTLIAMFVVFSALAILSLIFKNTGRFFMGKAATTAKDKNPVSSGSKVVKRTDEEGISGEVNAAIAMSLYLYESETHDYENTVLTIHKVSRNYSPWSSKIYTLRKSPR
ncbi:MAG TPA: OadG family transporter subunit [Prolixibacteraceae bacterium]|nr:OadG family transporter subunit [Prolixibacteraceae bacterium]